MNVKKGDIVTLKKTTTGYFYKEYSNKIAPLPIDYNYIVNAYKKVFVMLQNPLMVIAFDSVWENYCVFEISESLIQDVTGKLDKEVYTKIFHNIGSHIILDGIEYKFVISSYIVTN